MDQPIQNPTPTFPPALRIYQENADALSFTEQINAYIVRAQYSNEFEDHLAIIEAEPAFPENPVYLSENEDGSILHEKLNNYSLEAKRVFEFTRELKTGKRISTLYYGNDLSGALENDRFSSKNLSKYLNQGKIIASFNHHLHTGRVEFKNGKMNGNGEYLFFDGSRFSGNFLNNRLYGKGIYEYPDATRFIGNFEMGFPKNEGSLIYPDKTEFKGNYTSGSREGKGTIFYTDGRTFEGDFKNDSPHGEGTLSYPDGTLLSGSFVKAQKKDSSN